MNWWNQDLVNWCSDQVWRGTRSRNWETRSGREGRATADGKVQAVGLCIRDSTRLEPPEQSTIFTSHDPRSTATSIPNSRSPASHRRITSSPLPTCSPTISPLPYDTDSATMSAFERALPLALTVFCGVIGGQFTLTHRFSLSLRLTRLNRILHLPACLRT